MNRALKTNTTLEVINDEVRSLSLYSQYHRIDSNKQNLFTILRDSDLFTHIL